MSEPELGPLLATGNVAEVYAFGDDVLKLYKPGIGPGDAEREAEILSWLEPTGLPVPQLRQRLDRDGRYGLLMTRVNGAPFAETMRSVDDVGLWVGALAALHRDIHAVGGSGLRPLKQRLGDHIGRAEELEDAVRQRLLGRLVDMPAGDRLCHGDFHPYNVLGRPGEAVVIDWLDATCGDPAADLCRTWALVKPRADELADAYLRAYGLAPDAVFAWLPFVAAGRLAENISDDDRAFLRGQLERHGWR